MPRRVWRRQVTPTQARESICMFALDDRALSSMARDTVVETRGDFKDYRPGDIWKMLKGTVFQK